MSDEPISVDKPLGLRQAMDAGWSEAEVQWEGLQEAAAELVDGRAFDQAASLWGDALFLARQNFTGNDPRLATSLANHASVLRRSGDGAAAAPLFKEALLVWDASSAWQAKLKIERTARSSLFHLRMELRHRDSYQATARKRLGRFADEGRAAIAALAAGDKPERSGPGRWRAEKPPTYCDARKLLAAALLITPL